jgi:hypothetical protein
MTTKDSSILLQNITFLIDYSKISSWVNFYDRILSVNTFTIDNEIEEDHGIIERKCVEDVSFKTGLEPKMIIFGYSFDFDFWFLISVSIQVLNISLQIFCLQFRLHITVYTFFSFYLNFKY